MTQSILCAIDLAHPEDIQVLEIADKLAKLDDAQLDVITVVPNFRVTLVSSYFDDNFQEEMVKNTQTQLKAFVGKALGEERNKKVRHLVATGSVYEEILETAKRADTDLIVIGAHKPQLREFLLGPNAARVVRHSKCSVYVVRETD